jgi:ABC-type transport system involved in cytochrome c biogenesis permease subunit
MMAGRLLGERPLVGALLVVTALSLAGSLPRVFSRRKGLSALSAGTLALAFAANTAVIVTAWIEAGRAPFKTLYETLLLYPWCVWAVTVVLLGLYRLWVLVPFSAAANLAGLAYAVMRPDAEVVNLPPALQSVWFVPHVVTYFVAYAGLFASFTLAALALARRDWRSEESGRGFEDYAHRAAMFGIAALTLGLVMGALWGKAAWGDYWTWDPKENWALVSWLAYLVYLHLRLVRGWQGRPAMTVLALSFAAVVFTYLGMSLLPTAGGSLHVYQ